MIRAELAGRDSNQNGSEFLLPALRVDAATECLSVYSGLLQISRLDSWHQNTRPLRSD